MSRVHSKLGDVKYQIGTSTVATVVAGIKSWTLDDTTETLETTGFDSAGNRQFIAGIKEWGGSFEGHKDGVPLTTGTTYILTLAESETTGQQYTGTAWITGHHETVVIDGVVTCSYDYKGDGTLTIATA